MFSSDEKTHNLLGFPPLFLSTLGGETFADSRILSLETRKFIHAKKGHTHDPRKLIHAKKVKLVMKLKTTHKRLKNKEKNRFYLLR